MGLKPLKEGAISLEAYVAIEPLWDWNLWIELPTRVDIRSQSNHYGIETRGNFGLGRFSWTTSQSNHYGIETEFFFNDVNFRFNVAIEPLWDWNSHLLIFIFYSKYVAIEPLWDWNIYKL